VPEVNASFEQFFHANRGQMTILSVGGVEVADA
jgi:hypothetical protein